MREVKKSFCNLGWYSRERWFVISKPEAQTQNGLHQEKGTEGSQLGENVAISVIFASIAGSLSSTQLVQCKL